MTLASANSGPATDTSVTPQFKAVMLPSGRKGIRLESLFWRLLDEIARERKEKRNAVIADALDQFKPSEGNAASLLRCYVAQTQAVALKELSSRVDAYAVRQLLLGAPVSAFLVGRDKKLVEANPQFAQLVRSIAGSPDQTVIGDVQFTLESPIEVILKQLREPGDAVHCGFVIQLASRQRRGQAKLMRVPTPEPMLIGYILP